MTQADQAAPGPTTGPPIVAPAPGPDTVFFLSDYGTEDEFVGVVHAVLRRLAPAAVVLDLSHAVAPFDVAAGSAMLVRAVPHLGPGVVLAVVDPGVGGGRRAVVLETAGDTGPRWLVGPDNGLLVAAAELLGGVAAAVELAPPGPGSARTFDGRDVFAPAVADLCSGTELHQLGAPVDPGSLYRLDPPVLEQRVLPDGGLAIRAAVTWVDRFGNLQLAAPAEGRDRASVFGGHASAGVDLGGDRRVVLTPVGRGSSWATAGADARVVAVFGDLEPGELGVLTDANGRLAVVVREGSAATALGVAVDDVIELAERPLG